LYRLVYPRYYVTQVHQTAVGKYEVDNVPSSCILHTTLLDKLDLLIGLFGASYARDIAYSTQYWE